MKNYLILLAALLLYGHFLPAQRLNEYYVNGSIGHTTFSWPCTGLDASPFGGCCTACELKEKRIKTEYPPYIIAGGWRTYFFTDGENSAVASHPNSMVDASELNFKDNGGPPFDVTAKGNATWKLDYYSVYSAQYINHPAAGTVSMGFAEGENHHLMGTSPCPWMQGGTAVTFLCLTWTPNTQATNWGQQLFTDLGPIIWPATGYYYNGQKSSEGCANNNTIQADGYLYVFYRDQSCDNISAQMGPGRQSGIKVARAPVSDALNPLAYQTYYLDANNVVHWNPSLPAGFNKDNIDSYLSTPGPQGTSILGTDRNYNRFAVARVVGGSGTYYLGVGSYQDTNGDLVATLKSSPDLIHWSSDEREIYRATSAVTSLFNYPIFLSSDGWSNTTIDEDNFYVIGTHPESNGGVNNIVYKKKIFIPHPEPVPCNWYMHIPTDPSNFYDYSGATLGDIDITGDKLTIEALFNRTEDYYSAPDGGTLVSKQCNSTDANYFLRPKSGGITTTNGYFQIDLPCDLEMNTTYHVAMVYDGAHLSIYRNGILQASIAATGNLVTNDWQTTIGTEACSTPWSNSVNFRGYIGELRIWKKARTEQEIRQYYNALMPYSDYSNDPDLLAYYNFYNSANQGRFPGGASTFGSANFNQTNTICNIDDVGCFGFARKANNTVQHTEVSSAATDVVIYPNPASNAATLLYSSNAAGTITINVIDMTGKRAVVMRRSVMKGRNAIDMNLHSLSQGVYFVQLVDGSNTLTKKLIIK